MSWTEKVLPFLEQSWLGTTLTIVGLIVAYLSYVWSRRRTRLAYVYQGEHLLGGVSDSLPPQIVVQYAGESIPRLTKTTIIIWNNGENTVHRSDITAKDPLRLQIGTDGAILSVEPLKITREVNEFQVERGNAPNEFLFTFDFLDRGDGAVIEILHTSTNRKPNIKGTLKGLPKGFSNLGQFTRPKVSKKRKKGLFPFLQRIFLSPPVPGLIIMSVAFYAPSWLMDLTGVSPQFLTSMFSAAGGFYGMWLLNWVATRRRYPASLDLEQLEK